MFLCNTKYMAHKIFEALNKVELTGFLIILMPFANFVFKNYYYYLPIELILIFGVISIFYIGLIFISKIAKNNYEIVLFILSFFVSQTYHYYFANPLMLNNIYTFIVSIISAFIFLLVFVIKKKFKILNVFLVFCLLACTLPYFTIIKNDIVKNEKLVKNFNSNAEFKDVKFKNTPNIYCFHLESYSGNIALKHLFNYDNSKFLKELDNRGFYTWKNSFSNYDNTFMSLYSLFTMSHHYALLDVDNSFVAQKVVMGNKYNTLLKVLHENGYDINYYFYPTQFVKPFKSYAKFAKLYQITFLRVFNTIIQNPTDMADPNFPYDLDSNAKFLSNDLEKNLKSDKPQFYFVKFAKTRHFLLDFKFKPTFEENYISKLTESNIEILKMVDYIEKNDKNAIIILVGDHGSWRYRFSNDVKVKDFVLSQYNILLSIKNPYESVKNRPEILSNVNIFRYVISTLAENPNIMKNKRLDMSFGKNNTIFVENGKVFNELQYFNVSYK